jgi:hypothetical protein
MFLVWYEFTPFIFAVQQEGQTPLSSLAERREPVKNLWGQVFKRMFFFEILPIFVFSVLILFIFVGSFFQGIFVLLQSIFNGTPPIIPFFHGPLIGLLIFAGLFLYACLFQVPLQKVFLYLLYTDIKKANFVETEA